MWLLRCSSSGTLSSLVAMGLTALKASAISHKPWPAGAASAMNLLNICVWGGENDISNCRSMHNELLAQQDGDGTCILTPSMRKWCAAQQDQEHDDTAWRRTQLLAIHAAPGVCATSRKRAQLEFMRIVDIMHWTNASCATTTYDQLCEALQGLPRKHRDTRFMCNVLCAIRACMSTAFPLIPRSAQLYIKAMGINTQQSSGNCKQRRRWQEPVHKPPGHCSSSSSENDTCVNGEIRPKAMPEHVMNRLCQHLNITPMSMSVDDLPTAAVTAWSENAPATAEERLLFLLLSTLALRVSAIVRMRWSGVLDEETMLFRSVGHAPEKGGKLRGFVIQPGLCDALRLHLTSVDAMGFDRRPLFVFCGLSSPQTHRSQKWVNLCVSRWGNAIQFPGLHPHMFRHTLITDLVTKMNNSVELVAKFIDHSSPHITERYIWRDAPGIRAKAAAAAANAAQSIVDNDDLKRLMETMTDEELNELAELI